MKFSRNLLLSARALSAHKLRTALSLAGMSIGAAAVIMMTAAGRGARAETLDRLEAMGTNLLVVQAGRTPRAAGRRRQESLVTTLRLKDWEALGPACPSVALAAPSQEGTFKVKYGDTMTLTMILGSTPDYPAVCRSSLARGRLFTEEEDRASSRLAVLGFQVARDLFGSGDPLGETVRIGKIPFVVVGVLDQKGVGPDGANEDAKILIPVRTALRRVFNQDHIKAIFVQARSRAAMDRAAAEIRIALRDSHRLDRNGKPDDFSIQNQASLLSAAGEAGDSFTTLIAGVAAVSLIVGGIGILAVMIMTVRERTPEIGLRLAVGSRPRDILAQFMAEALLLGLAGGAAGAAAGLAGSGILGAVTGWTTAPPFGQALVAVAVSIAIGCVFGVFPARQAARLDPIRALKAE